MNRKEGRADIVFVVTNEISVRFLVSLVESMASRSCSVGLITNFVNGVPAPSIARFLSHHAHIPMRREPRPFADLAHLWRLRRAFANMRPRLVHVSTPKAGLLGAIASRSLRIPVVYEVRGYRAEGTRGPLRFLLLSLEKLTMRLASRVVFQSSSLRETMAIDGCTAPGKSVILGRGGSTGVDTTVFVPSSRAPGADPVCGFVGRIHRDKGIEDLVHVFRTLRETHPSLTLLLVGGVDPADRTSKDLERLCRDTAGIKLIGPVDDVVPHLQRMDVLIMPTRREGLPTAPLEAQACGVPVVGYRATGMVDAVEDGVGGYLVPVGDREQLARVAAQLLDDPELRAEIGRRGHDFVSTHFDSREVVARQVAYLLRLCATEYSGSGPDSTS